MTPPSPQLDVVASEPSMLATDPVPVLNVAVLLTCFNRREKTLNCVHSWWPQRQFRLGQQQVSCQLFILDNGSDGTGSAVAAAFPDAASTDVASPDVASPDATSPDIVVWSGHPDLYWNSGMRELWQKAIAHYDAAHFQYFLWLNDDVVLLPDALPRLLASALDLASQAQQPVGAVVGSMTGGKPDTGAGIAVPTYGGRLRSSVFNPLAFGPVLAPQETAQRCDFINGNLCLISAEAVQAVGLLSADYTHGCGDFDYGLRLQKAGFGLWVAPGFYGICATNPSQGSVFDASVSMRQRLAMLQRPNVLPPPAEWRRYARRHGGAYWPIAYCLAYFREVLPRFWLYLKQRHLPALTPKPKRVLIVQQVFKQYRLAFFKQLAAQLAKQGVELTIAFSAAAGAQRAKNDNIDVAEPGFSLRVPVYSVGPLIWQPVPNLSGFDVVVVEQANRHVLNYWLVALRLLKGKPKLVFWGHGFNHQAGHGVWGGVKEWGKRQMLRCPDAFFAYTDVVADYARRQGRGAITVLNNSIDTREFAAQVQSRRAPRELTPPYTLLFCGSLYQDKLLPVLLSATAALVQQGVVKKLIVLGDGPERHLITAAAADWLDYRGACFGEDKAAAFAEADLVLNPGLVGLAILDAFAAGLPVVTTDFHGHSPEIAYLQHGYNGLMVPAAQLVAEITKLLQQPDLLRELAVSAAKSAERYSLEAMVGAFVEGLQPLLAGNTA